MPGKTKDTELKETIIENKALSNDKEIADALNNYYVNSIAQIITTIIFFNFQTFART